MSEQQYYLYNWSQKNGVMKNAGRREGPTKVALYAGAATTLGVVTAGAAFLAFTKVAGVSAAGITVMKTLPVWLDKISAEVFPLIFLMPHGWQNMVLRMLQSHSLLPLIRQRSLEQLLQ